MNGDAPTVTIGRASAADITVPADATVSRLHAIIERVCGCWVIIDDGLSKNGTFVNGERVGGRRKLSSGDRIRLGRSLLIFRDGTSAEEEMTIALSPLLIRNSLTDAQIQVLEALCRPCGARNLYSYPASNRQIASDLCLTVSTVKTHLRALFQKFRVPALPPNQKRAFLVERAIESGVIADHEQ
ncbi:FHA domain-containing protein [Nocardia sp. R6R-6]|uniref:FHA domain-containing protein n=1 Tax=Nocardia sp. R6R-6 TaxID=3459303 RepID=UPI00403D8391